MGNALFIIWRESAEAMLVVGILYAWLAKQPDAKRGMRYLWAGVGAGIGLALALAAVMLGIAKTLSDEGLEYFQLGMMLVASGLIVQMVFWMRRHGRTFKRDLEADMASNASTANWWGLSVVVALAVGRESAETVVFLYGLGAQYPSMWSFVQVLVLGIGAAWLTFWALQQGSRYFSWRTFFRISEILLLLLAGALLVSAIEKLIALDVLPALVDPVWDTSALIDDSSRAGGLLASFTGYRARPALLPLILLAIYWVCVVTLLRRGIPAETRTVIDANAAVAARRPGGAVGAGLAACGEWLRRHARVVGALQWAIVAAYAFFIIVPAFLPLPPDDAHWFNNLAVFSQWLFWGLWWPFVILSMFVFGRAWCGLFCPEGTLTEAASRHGLGLAVPRWLKWGGWPFVAFALTTVFGQLVSVYQYPAATLLVLGGSTLAAIGVGLVYGRGKRVWCRHLCPVNGVFAVLARVAPFHFRVDTDAWSANVPRIRAHPVNCAPLVRIRRMTGPSECHMCGRCSGLHGAIALAARSPNREVVSLAAHEAQRWDAVLIVFGMIGLALGAFEWSATSAFVALRTTAIDFFVEHGPAWILADNAPWWILTNYPEAHDVFTWLDGALIAGWIVGTGLLVGGWVSVWLAVAARALPDSQGRTLRANAYALSYTLIPLAGAGLFVGLSGLPVALAHGEGVRLAWLPHMRAALLGASACWSFYLAYRQTEQRVAATRRTGAVVTPLVAPLLAPLLAITAAIGGVLAAWAPFVFR